MPQVIDTARIAASTITFRHLPLHEALDTMVQLGIPMVELTAFPNFSPQIDLFGTSLAEDDGVVAMVEASGLRVCSIHTAIGAFNNPATDAVAMYGAAERILRLATRLKAPAMGVGGGERIDRAAESLAQHIQAHASGLRRVAEMAQDAGIRMVIEAPHGGSLVQNADEAAALLEAIGHPNAYLIFDTAHHHRAGWDLARAVRVLGDRIAHVHLRDRTATNNVYPLGAGQIDFPGVFRALGQVGYRGPCSLEFPEAGTTRQQVMATVRQSLEYLKSLAQP